MLGFVSGGWMGCLLVGQLAPGSGVEIMGAPVVKAVEEADESGLLASRADKVGRLSAAFFNASRAAAPDIHCSDNEEEVRNKCEKAAVLLHFSE